MKREAVFFDRDGVLVRDVELCTRAQDLALLPGAAEATRALSDAGFALVVVSNQTVVARGLLEHEGVRALHRHLDAMLCDAGGVGMDAYYFCPHHARATVAAYRVECQCRKPRPGMLLRAAQALGLELGRSWMVGDRPTDIAAGARAGCRTVLVTTGMHLASPIEHPDAALAPPRPEHSCDGPLEAARYILAQRYGRAPR